MIHTTPITDEGRTQNVAATLQLIGERNFVMKLRRGTFLVLLDGNALWEEAEADG